MWCSVLAPEVSPALDSQGEAEAFTSFGLHTPWIWRGLSRLVPESDAISGLKTFVLNCLHSSIGF